MNSIQKMNDLELRASTLEHSRKDESELMKGHQTFDGRLRIRSDAESPLINHEVQFET